MESITIPADDGYGIRGTWWGDPETSSSVALIAGAMATPAGFYAPLAQWLAGRGVAALTFDYRGYGQDAPESLRTVTADARRWLDDARDVGRHVGALAGGRPAYWFGHSLGGQSFGLVENGLFARAIWFASGTGAMQFNTPAVRRRAPLLWRVIVPLTTRVPGYFPGARLGIMGDLPPRVARQWAGWCLRPDYVFDAFAELVAQYEAVTTPITSLYATDDELLARSSFEDLSRRYGGVDLVPLDPASYGLERIGHTGFFRRGNDELWETLLTPLLA